MSNRIKPDVLSLGNDSGDERQRHWGVTTKPPTRVRDTGDGLVFVDVLSDDTDFYSGETLKPQSTEQYLVRGDETRPITRDEIVYFAGRTLGQEVIMPRYDS